MNERMRMRTYEKCDSTISMILLRAGTALQSQSKILNKAPCFKIIKNFKMVTTEHESKCEALLRAGLCVAVWLVHPQSWPCSCPRHPIPGSPMLAGHRGSEFKHTLPSSLPSGSEHTQGLHFLMCSFTFDP